MKLTMSQALVQFLKNQFVERDNKKNAFFSGVWGIFGHGNVTGIGQALEQDGELKHFLPRMNRPWSMLLLPMLNKTDA